MTHDEGWLIITVVVMTMAARKVIALVMLTLAKTITIMATMTIMIASKQVVTVETMVPSTMGPGLAKSSMKTMLIRLVEVMTMVGVAILIRISSMVPMTVMMRMSTAEMPTVLITIALNKEGKTLIMGTMRIRMTMMLTTRVTSMVADINGDDDDDDGDDDDNGGSAEGDAGEDVDGMVAMEIVMVIKTHNETHEGCDDNEDSTKIR